jgi:hypothetical protein
MANWNEAIWGSFHWDSEPPNPNPKPKRKSMRLQLYFPVRIGNQIVWLHNFKTKLPAHATALGLVAGDVTAILLDVDNAIYALEAYRGAIATFPDAAYERIDDALHNDALAGSIAWLAFTAPAPVPTAVAYGCLGRVFAYINEVIKRADAYDAAIGADLGTEAPAVPAPDPTVVPEFDLRFTGGQKLEAVWTKGVFDGVKLEFDLGAAGIKTDMDLRPNYTLNWLPPTGTSAVIKVRLRYLYKGEEFGNWSPWQRNGRSPACK